jgi:hypothetical protein
LFGQKHGFLKGTPLSADELRKIDAYWRASLYPLSIHRKKTARSDSS